MKKYKLIAPLLALMMAACTDFNVPNTNGPSIDALLTNPLASDVRIATTGLFIGLRSTANTYAGTAGILGRESYNLDPSEVRNVLGYLVGPLEPGGFGTDFGWSTEYRTIRNANIVLHAIDALGTQNTDAQKEGLRGIAKSIEAAALINVIRIRNDIGAAIDVDVDRSSEIAPLVSKAAVYTRIFKLLDESNAHLAAAGASFAPFSLTSGFADFSTPANYIKFNKALRARADIYTNAYATALTDLAGSFISTAPADLQKGAYHVYSTTSGDATNPQYDPTARAWVSHESFVVDAQTRADGTKDLRAQNKVVKLSSAKILQGEQSDLRFTIYPNNTSPLPYVKDEELILIRSEAKWFTGDKAGAIADLNIIRTNSGGLPPSTLTPASTDAAYINALLYERRYSLVLEYGHRWVDMGRFGKLAELPKTVANRDRIFRFVPLPTEECKPRNNPPEQCKVENGI
jgi:hypothetical protein